MIRIVDILRDPKKNTDEKKLNAAGETANKEKLSPVSISSFFITKKTSLFIAKEDPNICEELINTLKKYSTNLANEKDVWTCLEKMVDQQMLGKTAELMDTLSRQPAGNEVLTHGVKVALTAVKMGIDLKYDRDQLLQLAVAALQYVLEPSKKLISDSLPSDYAKIVNLAKIHESW